MSQFEDRLRVFFGDLSEQTARVYASLDATLDGSAVEGVRLSGEIRGPYSTAGATLPAVTPMNDLPGGSPLCSALVTDPCFWITDHPAIYRVTIRLTDQDGQVKHEATKQIGFRPLGARAKSFFFDGRRWVMRAIRAAQSDFHDFEMLRETETTVICGELDTNFLTQASEFGVRILADLREHSDPAASLTRAANYPAVIAALLNHNTPELFDCEPKTLARNVMLIADSPSSQAGDANWADANWRSSQHVGAADCLRPTIVWSEGTGGAESLRSSIDRLQAELTSIGQFAGYAMIN